MPRNTYAQWWEKSGYFKPTPYKEGEKKSYVLPMPPPNVTGGLHMGHAMFVALQVLRESADREPYIPCPRIGDLPASFPRILQALLRILGASSREYKNV